MQVPILSGPYIFFFLPCLTHADYFIFTWYILSPIFSLRVIFFALLLCKMLPIRYTSNQNNNNKKIACDKHRVVIISLKVVSFMSLLDLQKKSSILSTWYATIVFLQSRVPPFFSIYFLFPTKLWASCVQNYTSDDNENNKTKSKIHTVI